MPYHVIVSPAAERTIERLPKEVRHRIAEKLVTLRDNPRPPGSIKLTGKDAYRIRVGDYRVIYSIHDDRLLVLAIEVGHRRDVYRKR